MNFTEPRKTSQSNIRRLYALTLLSGVMPDTTKLPKKLNSIQIRLDDESMAKLRALALEEHRTVANLISLMVLEGLKAREQK